MAKMSDKTCEHKYYEWQSVLIHHKETGDLVVKFKNLKCSLCDNISVGWEHYGRKETIEYEEVSNVGQ